MFRGRRQPSRRGDPDDSQGQVGRSQLVDDEAAAEEFFERMRAAVATGIDPGITVAGYVRLVGDRWLRGIDVTSIGDPYRAGMSRRVLPAFGHLPVRLVTAGLVDVSSTTGVGPWPARRLLTRLSYWGAAAVLGALMAPKSGCRVTPL